MSTKTAFRTKSKKQILIDLLKRKTGASPDDIVSATGWQPHSSRAALSSLRKAGFIIERTGEANAYRYRITAEPSQ